MLAGSDAVYDAAFRRAGMLRVGTMAELFEAAETLALTREQAGDRLAILTNGGGAGVLAVDALEAAGGRLAALAAETIERLGRVLPADLEPRQSRRHHRRRAGRALRRGARSAACRSRRRRVPGSNCPTALAEPEETARAVIDTPPRRSPTALRGRNIFTAWLGEHVGRGGAPPLQRRAHPDLRHARGGRLGFLHRVRYQRNRELLMETPPARPGPVRA